MKEDPYQCLNLKIYVKFNGKSIEHSSNLLPRNFNTGLLTVTIKVLQQINI